MRIDSIGDINEFFSGFGAGRMKVPPYNEEQRQEHQDKSTNSTHQGMSLTEKLEALRHLRKSYEHLPKHAYHAPVSHADFYQLLVLLESFFDLDWNSSIAVMNLSTKV